MWWFNDVNPICGACFANAAIRSCRVDTISKFDASIVFPLNGSMTRRPASLHRVSPGGIPRLPRYYQGAATPGRPSRLASFSFARRYHAAACGSLPRTTNGKRPRTRRLVWLALGRFVVVETAGPPTFLGNPSCLCPVLRPRRDDAYQAIRYAHAAPAESTTKAPAFGSFEAQSHGLGTRCLRFAGRITPPPRKTRFRLPARLYRTGLIPAGFQSKVSELSITSRPPLPSFVAQRFLSRSSCPQDSHPATQNGRKDSPR